ncbi:hypothetical protein AWR27_12560 [Spirosoma montaniterrae]|uniref:DUF11 domain-containing protein n=2 Tax=Spirosoma montaniterrae TaxID=1178516 RepID=A0A1P9WXH1_9BACT|nr:hypothetical protein AWR27_12560 [Spirosoma montaniterrae]
MFIRYTCSWLMSVAMLIASLSATEAQTLTQSNLPIVVINTTGGQTIPNEPGILADIFIYDKPGASVINDITIDTPTYTGKIDIETRGNSSQFFPKKSFGFETKDASGTTDINVSLFGMPAEEDWILNASYADKTFMRDMLTHHMARRMGSYSPRTKHVEVIVNGQYQGIYIAMEKIKRNAERVNISRLRTTDISGDDLTGGYILKIDAAVGGSSPSWTSPYPALGQTSNNPTILIEYPNAEDIQPQQQTYIQNHVTAFENALNGTSFKDPATGYRKYLDVDRAVDYFLIQEISKNVDAWRLSFFFYKEKITRGGLLKFGPPWDFDRSYGNMQWCYLNSVLPTGSWAWEYNLNCPSRPPLAPFWPKRLLEDCYFVEKLRTRYQTLRQSFLRTDSLHAFVDSNVARLTVGSPSPQSRNFQKWPILTEEIFYNEVYGNVSFAGEVADLKNWLSDHLTWMDANIGLIGLSPRPTATLAGNATVVSGQTTPLSLSFTGESPWQYTLSGGISGTATSSPTVVSVSPAQTQSYTLTSVQNACGSGTATGTALVTVQSSQADLSVNMVFANRSPAVNAPVDVSLVVSNAGPQNSEGVILRNRLPDNLNFVNTSSPAISHTAGVISVQVRDLAPGEQEVYTFTAQPTQPGYYQNAVEVSAATTTDPDSQPNSGTGDGQDDAALADLRTQTSGIGTFASPNPNQTPLPAVQANQPAPNPARVDLQLNMALASRTLTDNPVNLSVVVLNRGGLTATGVTVELQLPAGAVAEPMSGLAQAGSLLTLTFPSIAADIQHTQTVRFQFTASPPNEGVILAQVKQCNQADSDSTAGNGFENGEDDTAQTDWRRP